MTVDRVGSLFIPDRKIFITVFELEFCILDNLDQSIKKTKKINS